MEITSNLVNKRLLSPVFISMWVIMFMVEFVKGALIVAILPLYMGEVLHLSVFVIGLSFSLQYIGDNLFRSPAGWCIEHIGFRYTMLIGLIINFLGVLIIAFTESVGFIVLGCAMIGIGSAPLWPCVLMGISVVTEESNNFGTAMGVIQISSLGGTGLGPIIINFLVGRSYQLVFWVLLCFMVLAIFVSLLLPRKFKEKTSHAKDHHLNLNRDLGNVWQRVQQTFRHVRMNLHVSPLFYIALFLQTFAIGLLTPVITLFVRTELNFSPEAYSVLLVVGGGITLIGLVPVGKLVDRYGTRWFLQFGFLVATVAVGLFAVVRNTASVWSVVVLIGLSYSCILPTWDTMISHHVPKGEKGAVWGLFLTIQGSGMVVGPIVSGRMWDILGPTTPFLASSASMGLLFIIHMLLLRKKTGHL